MNWTLNIFMNEFENCWKLKKKRYHFNVWCVSEQRVVGTNVCCYCYSMLLTTNEMNTPKKHQHQHKWAIVNIEVASATVSFFSFNRCWLKALSVLTLKWTKKSCKNMTKWMVAVQLAVAKPRLYYVSISFKWMLS